MARTSRLRRAWLAWRLRMTRAKERDRVAAQRERILRDVGISMADFEDIARAHTGPATLLPRRLAAVGLDARFIAAADQALYSDLTGTCARCSSWRHCARDLAVHDVQRGLDLYCGNAGAIDQLLIDRTAGAKGGAVSERPAPGSHST